MARSGGQSAVMAVLTLGIGVFILHSGIEMVQKGASKIIHLGQSATPENINLGVLVVGMGIALLAAGAKLFVVAIEDSIPERITPEEIWEDTPLALKARLHHAVAKGYLRVIVKGDALHEMMQLPKQRHIRFVGKDGGVVEISKAMSEFIAEAPDDEIRAFTAAPVVINPMLTESFWSPQSTVAAPAQNY